MQPPISLLPDAISELFAQSSTSGNITLADRYGFMAALFDEQLSDDDRASIDRMLKALKRGRLRIVEDLSAEYADLSDFPD